VIQTEELAKAQQALEVLARLGLKARVEKARKVVEWANCIKDELAEHTYAVDELFAATDGSAMTEARAVLEQLAEDALARCYPPTVQAGSLHEEDEILADVVPGVEGAYVEVGAWRPVEQSNTWQFYSKGWRGVLVEPVPAAWPALLHQRVGDFLVPFAASNRNGFRRMIASGPTSVIADGDGASLVVETRTMAEIMDGFPDVRDNCRLCSIDVEGHEREVIEGIDWGKFRPAAMVIEHKDHIDGGDTSGKWADLVTAQGYEEVGKTENNTIFKRV
jgi:FkbM family methyltransferase